MLALKPGSCQPYGTISIILAIRKTFMEMTKQEMVRKVKTGQLVLLRLLCLFYYFKSWSKLFMALPTYQPY